MPELLKKLGVPRNVRLFFQPYMAYKPDGSIVFPFGTDEEHFNTRYHRVPAAVMPWIAGYGPVLCYSNSAMDAIAFLTFNGHRFRDLSLLRFVALGTHIGAVPLFDRQSTALIFDNGLTGRLTDIKVAAALTGRAVSIGYAEGTINFQWYSRLFSLREHLVSLHAFERMSGLRSGIRTLKPKPAFGTFTQQLLTLNDDGKLLL